MPASLPSDHIATQGVILISFKEFLYSKKIAFGPVVRVGKHIPLVGAVAIVPKAHAVTFKVCFVNDVHAVLVAEFVETGVIRIVACTNHITVVAL